LVIADFVWSTLISAGLFGGRLVAIIATTAMMNIYTTIFYSIT